MVKPFVRAGILISVATVGGHLVAADPVRATLVPSAERQTAEMIKLKDDSGKTVDLASYGGYVMLVDFWATWCGGCKQELPWFQEFETKYGDRKFGVVAVSMDHEGWRVVKPLIESLKIAFKVVLDDGDTSRRYSFKEMPAAFLIDREGRLASRQVHRTGGPR